MQCRSLLSNYTFLPYFKITYIYATNFCRLKYLIGSDVDVDNKLILHKRFKWGLRSDKLKGFAGEILFFQKNSATTSQSESKQVQCEVKTFDKTSLIYLRKLSESKWKLVVVVATVVAVVVAEAVCVVVIVEMAVPVLEVVVMVVLLVLAVAVQLVVALAVLVSGGGSGSDSASASTSARGTGSVSQRWW